MDIETLDDLIDSDLDAIIAAPKKAVIGDGPLVIAPAAPEHIETCQKCRGTGNFPAFSSRPVGRCFVCKGKGMVTYKTSKEARAKAGTARVVKKARTAAENLESFKALHPDVFAWFDGSTFGFAVAMREAVAQYGHLTPNQLAASQASAAKLAAAKAASAARVEQAVTVDLSKIEESLKRAAAKMRSPRLRLAGLTISLAGSASRNAGSYYVKSNGDGYLGKITGGKFIRSRECTDELEARLIEVSKDPREAAIQYGRETGTCACCGRELTNPVSIEAGIGPICEANFFG